MPFLLITTFPTLFITYALIAKSIDLYKKQHQLSIYSLSIFSTILSLIPLLAISDALLSVDILFGRYADKLSYAVLYLVFHVSLDVLLAGTGAILIGSSVMLIMAPDLSSFQERIIKSAKYVVLGELATHITYQLEGPLKKIKILSELMLKDNKISGDLIKDLKIISRESGKAMDIAGDLLDYSHTSESHFQITNLKALLDDVFSFMEPKYRHSGIRVVKKLQRPLPYLSADRGKLKHAFIDILNNSIDFLPDGGHIIISAYIEGDTLTMTFHDNAPSMGQETLKKIFEPFYAAEPDGRGTGLGLSVAWSVIQNHGGEIIAKNGEENGRDIIVKLPILEDKKIKQHSEEKASLIS
ncbi:MAG TPA: HAMP domain-containing histidine kinase [Actinobacteria bacterium]|nr:HAMP domain-containing histidine kinase [Actinomycetes bacterium]HEX21456.1 HAMP domain-containing histidine kinase [Actinomycetota bacterium]